MNARKYHSWLKQFEDLITNLEQPSTQASTDVRQLRSALKTARERMDQIASRFKKFRSQTESTFEQLMSRMNTFQSGGNTSGTTTDATTHPAVPGKLRKRRRRRTHPAQEEEQKTDREQSEEPPLEQRPEPEQPINAPSKPVEETLQALRYRCANPRPFDDMVSIIKMAQDELKLYSLDERGYLILETDITDSSLVELWEACEVPQQTGTVQGFKLYAKPSGYMPSPHRPFHRCLTILHSIPPAASSQTAFNNAIFSLKASVRFSPQGSFHSPSHSSGEKWKPTFSNLLLEWKSRRRVKAAMARCE
jgi:hypothetical protein